MTTQAEEDFEHRQFMRELTLLREQLFAAWETSSKDNAALDLTDIEIFGTEPIFSGMVHDALIAEANDESNR